MLSLSTIVQDATTSTVVVTTQALQCITGLRPTDSKPSRKPADLQNACRHDQRAASADCHPLLLLLLLRLLHHCLNMMSCLQPEHLAIGQWLIINHWAAAVAAICEAVRWRLPQVLRQTGAFLKRHDMELGFGPQEGPAHWKASIHRSIVVDELCSARSQQYTSTRNVVAIKFCQHSLTM